MKRKIKLVNLKELEKIIDRVGEAYGTFQDLEPYINLRNRIKYQMLLNNISYFWTKLDDIYCGITDSTER